MNAYLGTCVNLCLCFRVQACAHLSLYALLFIFSIMRQLDFVCRSLQTSYIKAMYIFLCIICHKKNEIKNETQHTLHASLCNQTQEARDKKTKQKKLCLLFIVKIPAPVVIKCDNIFFSKCKGLRNFKCLHFKTLVHTPIRILRCTMQLLQNQSE